MKIPTIIIAVFDDFSSMAKEGQCLETLLSSLQCFGGVFGLGFFFF